VVQSLRAWLPQTQKWLATQLAHLPPDLHAAVACDRTENLDQFPQPDLACRADSRPRLADRLQPSGARRRFVQRVLRQRHASLLHAHFGHIAWMDSAAAARAGVPLVASFYGFDATQLPHSEPEWGARYGELFDRAALVLAEAPAMAATLRGLGCPAAKLRVHHLGTDVATLPFRPRQARDGPLRVLMVGRFVEKKGMPDGIRAVAAARQAGVDATLTIVGGPSDEPRGAAEAAAIEAAVAGAGLGGRLRMLGPMPFADLVGVALEHDVLLCPSKTAADGDSEGGLPVTLIELGGTGMPIVATRHADIPEFVHDGENGILAEPGDVDALARALGTLASSPERWGAMAAASRRRVDAEFDARRQGERLGAIYREAGGQRL